MCMLLCRLKKTTCHLFTKERSLYLNKECNKLFYFPEYSEKILLPNVRCRQLLGRQPARNRLQVCEVFSDVNNLFGMSHPFCRCRNSEYIPFKRHRMHIAVCYFTGCFTFEQLPNRYVKKVLFISCS